MTTTVRPAVAVLGMGNMGQALAARLLGLNYPVWIWNRSARDLVALTDIGARVLASRSSIWKVADVAITFVANDDALRDVCLGSEGILREPVGEGLFIDMSTVSPEVSEEIAGAAERAGVDYLRSPVSGNPSVLAAGGLTLIVSGSAGAVERWRSLLADIGPTVRYVGGEEQARLVKLAINAGLAITTEMLAELIVLTERFGLDRESFLEVLGQSVLGSAFVKYKSTGLLARNYEATFTTALLAKDLRLALDLAHKAQLSLPAIELTASLVEGALDGYADADFAALLPHLQRAHGQALDLPPTTCE
jgi:3-hydroxyisobutyrate dehydrogenase-like beta-hydroxyacid dehydrogenase